MEIQPSIVTLSEIKLIGKRVKMSFFNNKTKDLWQNFMPKRSEIKNNIGSGLYSIEIYNDPEFFQKFNPNKEFEKWAAIQVSDLEQIPNELEAIKITSGLYAVFPYKGKASEAPKFYQYIFGTWIPNSEFSLEDRPHFAIMGEKYKGEDPTSEEELWIPIKKK